MKREKIIVIDDKIIEGEGETRQLNWQENQLINL